MKNAFIVKVLMTIMLLNFQTQAQNQKWELVTSKITFKIKNAGITVDGSLSGLAAEIFLSPDKIAGNRISAKVDANTINTGNGTRDGHLKKEEYFDVSKYPEIKMISTLIVKQAAADMYNGYFKLTIRNVTKEITIPIYFKENAGGAIMSGSFKLNRLDYNVGESSIILSDDVNVKIELQLKK